MKIALVLMLFFPTGEIKVVHNISIATEQECVNKVLLVNQDKENPFTAFCHYNVTK